MASTERKIAVNGRFSNQHMTGVQRYGKEICDRLADRLNVIVPEKVSGGVKAHVWEQFSLPKHVRGSTLWSPCGTGPLSVRRHVVTIHDTGVFDIPECFDWKFGTWYRWLVPRLARKAAALLTVSEFSKRQIVKHFDVDPERITVAPSGVEGFSPASEESIAEMCKQFDIGSKPYLLAVGSLKPNKNLVRLLKAWELAKLADSGIELLIVGGVMKSFRKSGIEQLPEGARLLGYVDDKYLAPLYTRAMAFVLPSLYEGLGLTAFEAMACNTPVVASKTTALGEFVADAGVLVDPESIESIADGLRKIVGDQNLRETLRERGLVHCKKFTWDHASTLVWKTLSSVDEQFA